MNQGIKRRVPDMRKVSVVYVLAIFGFSFASSNAFALRINDLNGCSHSSPDPISTSQLTPVVQALTSNSENSSSSSSSNRITVPNKYSINLMWINKTKDANQKYISSAKDEEKLNSQLLSPIIKWAIANPTAEINLWYDSAHAPDASVRNTEQVMQKQLHEKGIRNVRIRDVLEIPIVKNNPDVFSDQTPLYFRIDLLKPIILVHSIEAEGKDSAIFSDLEVGDLRPNKDRMGKDELFNSDIMEDLNAGGLMMGMGENQFFQLVKKPSMISAIKHFIVNANLVRAERALNKAKVESDYNDLYSMTEKVFYSTNNGRANVFAFHLFMLSGNKLFISPSLADKNKNINIHDSNYLEYNPEIHGYTAIIKWQDQGSLLSGMKDIITNHEGGDASYSRKVDVRLGHSHGGDFSLTLKAPASGTQYQTQLWK